MQTPLPRFWLLAAMLLLISLPCRAAQLPNVLILLSDDQRVDTIHALGNPRIQTPNLDRLVESGTAFTRAYIVGSMHGALCAPSRAMLMTSLNRFRIKENMAGQATWPEQFAKAGYRTFMTGKWHNGQTSAARVFPQARDVFFGGMTTNVSRFPVHDIADGTVGPERTTSKHQTELFVDNAIEFIRHQTNGQPFFCYVAFKSPHDPRIATPAWHAFYNTNPPPVPVSFLPQHPFNNGDMEVRDEQLLPWPRTPEAVRKEIADHYACVSHVDEQIGRLLKQLESAGLLQTTLIVFASDNGLSLGDHGLIGKQNLYEFGGMNVPLILSGPGVPKNRRTDAFCYLMDVMPTVAGLAKVPALEGIDGRSLVPVLEGKEKSVWPVIFTSYRDCQRAIRDEQWKLIRYPLVDRTQLYDLAADPHELKDLSGQPDEAERITRMLSLMAQYQREFGDTAPLKVANPKPAAWTPPEFRGTGGSPKKGSGKQKAKKETSTP